LGGEGEGLAVGDLKFRLPVTQRMQHEEPSGGPLFLIFL
jgi:hypothetical protein